MKKKNGFTLIELLAVIVIIALLGSVGAIGFSSFFKTGEERYYDTLEGNVLLSGNDYFADHRDQLPAGNNISEVTLNQLIDEKYMEMIYDSNGNVCANGKVVVYREKGKYKYEVCIKCGNHNSNGRYCDNIGLNEIYVTAKTSVTGRDYDVSRNYGQTEYVSGENVTIYLSMDESIEVSKYTILNTRDKNSVVCDVSGGNECERELGKSGSYRITAYDESNKEISTRYINVKIAKGGSPFSLTGEDLYTIDTNSCSNNNKTKKVKINIIQGTPGEEYKLIEYKINDGEYKSADRLVIEEELESGHYKVDFEVTNHANDVSLGSFEFDVAYTINLSYESDNTKGEHQVVKGQTYNYLYEQEKGEKLPEIKKVSGTDVEIKWYKGNTLINPDEDIVTDDCTFTLLGKTSVPVPSDDIINGAYCKSEEELKYIGSDIPLTNDAPDHVTFINTSASTVGPHTVKARVDTPLYSWSDGTTGDKEFTCTIGKGDNPITIVDNQVWQTTASSNSKNNTFTGASNAAGEVTYSIVSQTPGTHFSMASGATTPTITMQGGTTSGSYTVVIRASAAGNANYNPGYKDMSTNIAVGVQANPMEITTPQTWSATYATAAQNYDFTGASNAQGNVTYAILSQKNSNNETVNKFSIPTSSTPRISMAANTPVGTYNVEINVTAEGNGSYASKTSKIELEVTVGSQKCAKPTNLSVSNDGIVTWTSSSNCSGQHQVKVGNGSYQDASSGADKLDDILSESGNVTIYVKAVGDNNFAESEPISVTKEVCSANISKTDGIGTITPSQKYINGKTLTLSATVQDGYEFKNWTSGSDVISTNTSFTTSTCNINYKANAESNAYTVTYVDNLFTATSKADPGYDGISVKYEESGSYLTLNGTNTGGTFFGSSIWNYERRTIKAGDQYQVTINYISGSYTRSDTSQNARLYIELTKDGEFFDDRGDSPAAYKIINFPTSANEPTTGILTVGSNRTAANGFTFRLHEQTAGNATFTDYKIQVIVTKVHDKTVNYGAAYGTLDKPTKTGYDFNGWYTAITGGSQVTDTSVYNRKSDQTLYAHWTSHKLYLRYNGTSYGSWCGTGTKYTTDDAYYVVKQEDSSRNIQVRAFGQYIDSTTGLLNYNNKSYICFERDGYHVAPGSEWYLHGDTSKVYDHSETAYTSHGIANDAGCNLKTESTCTVRLNVRFAKNVTPTVTLSKSSGYNCINGTFKFTATANVAGKYTVSSSNTSYATVSLSSATVDANTATTITVSGKKTKEVTITVKFTPTDTYYSAISKKLTLDQGYWKGAGSYMISPAVNCKDGTAGYQICNSAGEPQSFCCKNKCSVTPYRYMTDHCNCVKPGT